MLTDVLRVINFLKFEESIDIDFVESEIELKCLEER